MWSEANNVLNKRLKIQSHKLSKNRQGDLDEILHVGGSQFESSRRKQSNNTKKNHFNAQSSEKKSVRFFCQSER